MKNKKEGFVLIEVIISLSVICLAVYMISNSLYENYSSTENNKKRIEMLNTAKQHLESAKSNIKSKTGFVLSDYEDIKYVGNYQIIRKIQKEEKNYQCYKVNIEVNNNNQKINLESYVFKR